MSSSDKLSIKILNASERLRKVEAAIEDAEKVAGLPNLEIPATEYANIAAMMRVEAKKLREAIERMKDKRSGSRQSGKHEEH